MSIIPTQISLGFFLIALSKKNKGLQILQRFDDEKVFGKSEIRQNCLTRRHSQHFDRFESLKRRAVLRKSHPIASTYP